MDIKNIFEFRHLNASEYYELQNDSIYNPVNRRMYLFWDRGYAWKDPENIFDLVVSIYRKEDNVLVGSFSLDKINKNHEYLLSVYIKGVFFNNDTIMEDALKEFINKAFKGELTNRITKESVLVKAIRCYTLKDEGLLACKLRKAGFKYNGVVNRCLCNYEDEWEDGEQYEIRKDYHGKDNFRIRIR